MKFRTILIQAGKTATGVEVPATIVAALNAGKKPPVKVTINGFTYRSTVAVMGGKFMIGVSAAVRESAKIAGGEKVDVNVELDNQPREVTVPAELKKALAANAKAKKFFEGLSYSGQLRHVLSIEGAKTAETRERRVVKAIDDLKKGIK